jgi:hypothetical protein
MKVARSALPVTLAHWERAGARETVMAAATYILWGGADAMSVSFRPATGQGNPMLPTLLAPERDDIRRQSLAADRVAVSARHADFRFIPWLPFVALLR